MDLDSIIQNSDDSESSRQLVDYLKKQLDNIDPEKRETPAETKTRKRKLTEKDQPVVDFMS